jgi:hypothetical protein
MKPENKPELAPARNPSLELWVALGLAVVPHAVAFLTGGYARVVTILPLAAGITVAGLAALGVVALEWRGDRAAQRPTHPVVWITAALVGIWILYAVAVLVLYVVVQVFCINQTCRGPLG